VLLKGGVVLLARAFSARGWPRGLRRDLRPWRGGGGWWAWRGAAAGLRLGGRGGPRLS